jgi:DNA repair exonuclease SbcCD ATPase subunit
VDDERPDNGTDLPEPEETAPEPPAEAPAPEPTPPETPVPPPPAAVFDDEVAEETITSDRLARVRGGVLVVVVVALLLGAIAGTVLSYNAFTRRTQAQDALAEALELVERADDAVLAVDEVVRADVTPDLTATAGAALALVPDAKTDLDDAIELADRALPNLSSDDQEIARAVQEAAGARLEMLVDAEALMQANGKASGAIEPAEDGLDELLEADSLAEESITKYNLHTDAGVQESTQLAEQALALLGDSKAHFTQALEAYPEADMGPFVDYIDERIALLQESIEINKTWLSGDKPEANEMLKAYNEKEQELAETAAELPDSGTAVIAATFQAEVSEETEAYLTAREAAGEADTRLRGLLEAQERESA